MLSLRTEIELPASPNEVWRVLLDFDAYPDWNPFIRSVSGKAEVGQRLIATVQPIGGKPMGIGPKVLKVDAEKELRWRGSLPIPGLFTGEHFFALSPLPSGKTHFIHGENFSGLLVALVFKGKMGEGTRRGFTAMNEALKARLELLAAAKK
jgi:hypothetical protein